MRVFPKLCEDTIKLSLANALELELAPILLIVNQLPEKTCDRLHRQILILVHLLLNLTLELEQEVDLPVLNLSSNSNQQDLDLLNLQARVVVLCRKFKLHTIIVTVNLSLRLFEVSVLSVFLPRYRLQYGSLEDRRMDIDKTEGLDLSMGRSRARKVRLKDIRNLLMDTLKHLQPNNTLSHSTKLLLNNSSSNLPTLTSLLSNSVNLPLLPPFSSRHTNRYLSSSKLTSKHIHLRLNSNSSNRRTPHLLSSNSSSQTS